MKYIVSQNCDGRWEYKDKDNASGANSHGAEFVA